MSSIHTGRLRSIRSRARFGKAHIWNGDRTLVVRRTTDRQEVRPHVALLAKNQSHRMRAGGRHVLRHERETRREQLRQLVSRHGESDDRGDDVPLRVRERPRQVGVLRGERRLAHIAFTDDRNVAA